MKNNLYILSALFLPLLGYSQINFTQESWSEIKKKARLENKAIFVDIYTKWCGPCKKLDKTTFQDVELGTYMNTHFINVKWDAESIDYQQIARAHGIASYPTLIFMDHNEVEHKRIVGYQNKSRLFKQSKDIIKFLTTDFASISKALIASNNKEEIEFFLMDNKGLNFKSKDEVFDVYFESLSSKDALSGDELEILIDNLKNVTHVEKAVLNLPTGRPKGIDEMRKKVRYQSIIKAVITAGIENTTKYKQLESFEKYLDLNYQFAKKINSLSKGEFALNDNIDYRLTFYSKHKMKEKYVAFVDEVIKEKITPFSPEKVKSEDHAVQSIIKKLSDTSQNNPSVANGRSILKQRSQSFKKATLLNTIAANLYSFFGDDVNLRKSLNYAELATAYLDIPEARLTRAKVLNKLGQSNNAITQVDLGLQSQLLDWRIKSDLLGLRKSISK